MAIRPTKREFPIEDVLASRWLVQAARAGRRWNSVPETHLRALPAAVARCKELGADPVEFVDAFYHRYSVGWCSQKFKTPVVPMFALASPFADQILWGYRLHKYNQDLESSNRKGAIGDLVRKIEGENKRIAAMPSKLRETAYSCGDVSSLWVALRMRVGLPVLVEVDPRDREVHHDLKTLDSLAANDLQKLPNAIHGHNPQSNVERRKTPRQTRDYRNDSEESDDYRRRR